MQELNSGESVWNSTDKEKITSAYNHFKNTLESQKRLDENVERALKSGKDAIQAISKLVGEDLFKVELSEQSLVFSANERCLILIPAGGTAVDSRLPNPRLMLCRQILVFAHIDTQETSHLIKSFRVYADGLCTDGETTWNLDESNLCMTSLISKLIIQNIFEGDLLWPEFERFPDYLLTLPIAEGKPLTEDVLKPCIGFECVLRKPLES